MEIGSFQVTSSGSTDPLIFPVVNMTLPSKKLLLQLAVSSIDVNIPIQIGESDPLQSIQVHNKQMEKSCGLLVLFPDTPTETLILRGSSTDSVSLGATHFQSFASSILG